MLAVNHLIPTAMELLESVDIARAKRIPGFVSNDELRWLARQARLPAAVALPHVTLLVEARGLDLLFLAGADRFEAVRSLLEQDGALVKPGGLIAGAGYRWADRPGIRRAVDAKFPRVNLQEGIWWSRV
jgi:hypothetical protein